MSISELKKKQQLRGTAKPNSVLIAVGGGKGGVGKSFVSTNLSIFLANMGFNTMLVDLDLGAPNLHTYLGEEHPNLTFHDFLKGKEENLENTAIATKFPKLRLISGGNDHSELADISIFDESKLCRALYRLNADFTILDLSAGTHTSTLDFFLMATHQLVVLTPEPTSIENAYRFMKAAYFRKIKRFEAQLGLRETIKEIMDNSEENKIRFPTDLTKKVAEKDPTRGLQLVQTMAALDFNLVLNQTRSSKDVALGDSIRTVCSRYFGVPTRFLGGIQHDNAAWHSLRNKRPLLLDYPQSGLYNEMLRIARDLASPHMKKAVV